MKERGVGRKGKEGQSQQGDKEGGRGKEGNQGSDISQKRGKFWGICGSTFIKRDRYTLLINVL